MITLPEIKIYDLNVNRINEPEVPRRIKDFYLEMYRSEGVTPVNNMIHYTVGKNDNFTHLDVWLLENTNLKTGEEVILTYTY